MAEGDRARGLYQKYDVLKWDADGNLVSPGSRCFVLAYDTDPHARVALAAYARSCEDEFPILAADLRKALST